MVEPSREIFPGSDADRTTRRPVGVSARLSTRDWSEYDEARTHRGQPPGLHTSGRTPCGTKPERTMPSRSPFGARMQWPEPAYTEQSLARLARPTKGGAVRIRVALGTALAVIAIPAIFFACFSSTSAATSRLTRHEAI